MKLVSCHVKNASRAEYGGAHLQSPNLRGRSRRISVRPADSLAHMAKQGYVVRPCHKTKQNRLSLYRFTLYGYIYNHAFQRSRPTAQASAGEKTQLPLPACPLVLCTSHGHNTNAEQLAAFSKNCSPASATILPTPPHPAYGITRPGSPVCPLRLPSPASRGSGAERFCRRGDSAGGTSVSTPWRPCVLCCPELAARCCPRSATQNSGASPRVSAHTGGVLHLTLGGLSPRSLRLVS